MLQATEIWDLFDKQQYCSRNLTGTVYETLSNLVIDNHFSFMSLYTDLLFPKFYSHWPFLMPQMFIAFS